MIKWDLLITLILAGLAIIFIGRSIDRRKSNSTQSDLNNPANQAKPLSTHDWVRRYYPNASTI